MLQSLLAQRSLAAADDTAVLVLHQVLLGQAAGRVLGRAVEDLSLGADSGDLRTAVHDAGASGVGGGATLTFTTILAVLASVRVGHFLQLRDKK